MPLLTLITKPHPLECCYICKVFHFPMTRAQFVIIFAALLLKILGKQNKVFHLLQVAVVMPAESKNIFRIP